MTDQKIIRAVAEKVMGWKYEDPEDPYWLDENGEYVMGAGVDYTEYGDWNPLTNPAHYMMVVERMRELGWRCKIESFPDNWGATFFKDRISVDAMADIHEEYYEFNTNLGAAICEAALRAVEAT